MATARKLKVFRTSIGFHDAYVAAPSQKAALAAWGAEKDLFAIGAAELVTDPALTAEPLKSPGQVIKRSRGGLAEQLAALPKTKVAKPAEKPPAPPLRKSKPKPRPSRTKLTDAETAAREWGREAEAELSALREREAELGRERQALEQRHEAMTNKLDRQLSKAREQYDRALSKWRDES